MHDMLHLTVRMPREEIGRWIAPWLFEWIWPVDAGDTWGAVPDVLSRRPRVRAAFAPPTRGVDLEVLGLEWFREVRPGGPAPLWITSLGGEAAAELQIEPVTGGISLRVRLHETLAADQAIQQHVARRIAVLTALVDAESLALRELALDGAERLSEAVPLLQREAAEREQRACAGALASPWDRVRLRWLQMAGSRAGWAVGAAPARPEPAAVPPPRSADAGRRPRRSRVSDLLTSPSEGIPFAELWSEPGRARRLVAWRGGALVVDVLGEHEALLRQMTELRCDLAVIGLGSLPAPSTPETVAPCAALIGPGARDRLVSARLLSWGPWRARALAGDRLLLEAESMAATPRQAELQRSLTEHLWSGLLTPLTPELPGNVRYEAASRALVLHPRSTRSAPRELAHLIGCARQAPAGMPVERVIARVEDPMAAALWLPILWLREVEVWTVQAGSWARIDEDYAPGWEAPDWVRQAAEHPLDGRR